MLWLPPANFSKLLQMAGPEPEENRYKPQNRTSADSMPHSLCPLVILGYLHFAKFRILQEMFFLYVFFFAKSGV